MSNNCEKLAELLELYIDCNQPVNVEELAEVIQAAIVAENKPFHDDLSAAMERVFTLEKKVGGLEKRLDAHGIYE